MATPNYDINYNDERFKNVESAKQNALTQINDTYNNMINQSDKFYQDQINAANDYAQKQSEIQQANTDFAIEKINQQKDQTRKDYLKEQTGAYVDWQKQSNQYGANAEQMATQGLTTTGYSESSQVSMYNTYQNRISTARDSYNRAVLNYDNSIKEAMLTNNAALAEIAYNALKNQLELSLQGFQYKNTLLETQINEQQEADDRYHQRWQDVLSQMNTENALKEEVRQYNEKMAEEARQFNERLAEETRQYNEKMAYQKERDRIADEQWQKEYNLSLANSTASRSSGGGSYSSGGSKSSGGKTYEVNTAYYQGKRAANVGNFGYFSNGYQPKGVLVGGTPCKLSAAGQYTFTTYTLSGQKQIVTQTKWAATKNGKTYYYYWDGRQNAYVKL